MGTILTFFQRSRTYPLQWFKAKSLMPHTFDSYLEASIPLSETNSYIQTYYNFIPNFFSRVLQLIHEAKWLTRLGIQIPEAAHHIMVQESRFKSYNDHLQLCITDFKEVCLY